MTRFASGAFHVRGPPMFAPAASRCRRCCSRSSAPVRLGTGFVGQGLGFSASAASAGSAGSYWLEPKANQNRPERRPENSAAARNNDADSRVELLTPRSERRRRAGIKKISPRKAQRCPLMPGVRGRPVLFAGRLAAGVVCSTNTSPEQNNTEQELRPVSRMRRQRSARSRSESTTSPSVG